MDEPVPAIIMNDVTRIYKQGTETLNILKGIDLCVKPGEVIGLIGSSGTGKSTLLHIAGLLEFQNSGEIYIAGESCTGMNDDARTKIRREKIGFVYQFHHLLPEFTALENIIIPQIISGLRYKQASERAKELLEWLNLSDRQAHRPARLSGGEKQRIAIARAVASKPSLLLADEPTGNLDPETATIVFNIMLQLAKNSGLAAIIATHNVNLVSKMDRVVKLKDGKLS